MISVDTLDENKAFAAKEKADFPMLANPDKKVALAYGVITPDMPADRQFARRFTFYIDPAGKLALIDKGASGRGINPATSGDDLLKHLDELKVPKH